MQKEVLLEYIKDIRCKSRGKSGPDVAAECIKLVEEKFKSTKNTFEVNLTEGIVFMCELSEEQKQEYTTLPKPLPCPFCGAEPYLGKSKGLYYIHCRKESPGSVLIYGESKIHAIKRWNQRKPYAQDACQHRSFL